MLSSPLHPAAWHSQLGFDYPTAAVVVTLVYRGSRRMHHHFVAAAAQVHVPEVELKQKKQPRTQPAKLEEAAAFDSASSSEDEELQH